jgi:hypothetical protein
MIIRTLYSNSSSGLSVAGAAGFAVFLFERFRAAGIRFVIDSG